MFTNGEFSLRFLVIAAATKNYNYSKNDDPGAVVVEEMAQAVVIHKICSSKDVLRFFCAHFYLMPFMCFVIQKAKPKIKSNGLSKKQGRYFFI